MQDIVILPTYDRPEMLWVCLEYLAASPESQSVQIRVCVDAHVGQSPPSKVDIDAVVAKFPQLSIRVTYRRPHQFHGNSFNVLTAYKEAFETDAQYVYLVEDDILIHPEFFAWHQRQQTQPWTCSIAVVKEPFHGPYASWGVCFPRNMLRLVIPHCRPEYFQNMQGYCKQQFPLKPWWHCEQDGLLCRILKDQPIVWPTTPFAQHVGWYGYHRPQGIRPTGSLDDRYRQVKQALADDTVLQSVIRDKFGDVHPLVI